MLCCCEHDEQTASRIMSDYNIDLGEWGVSSVRALMAKIVDCCIMWKKQNKKLPNLSVLDKNAFFTEICWERHQISTSATKYKQAKANFHFFFINQTSLVNIYVKNAANLQSRARRNVFGGVQP